jgi:hypothetical protein
VQFYDLLTVLETYVHKDKKVDLICPFVRLNCSACQVIGRFTLDHFHAIRNHASASVPRQIGRSVWLNACWWVMDLGHEDGSRWTFLCNPWPHISKRPTPNWQGRVVKRLLMGYGFRSNVNRPNEDCRMGAGETSAGRKQQSFHLAELSFMRWDFILPLHFR